MNKLHPLSPTADRRPSSTADRRPRTVAITGGIGSGKSFVCRMLEERGESIFYCDAVAKDIIAHDTDVRRDLTDLIGGEPSKERLGTYLRTSPDHAARVNAIVHPRVAEAFRDSGQRWMECAILFESGFDSLVDDIVVVTCPEDERIRRIVARDHCSPATARRWLALQMTDEERLRRADATLPTVNGGGPAPTAFHIVNDGVTPIEPQLEAILQRL